MRLQSVRQESDFGRNIYYAALSKAHRDSAAEYGGGDLPFAGVVYNGVDLERFRPAATATMPVSSSGNGNVKDKNTSPPNVTDTGFVTETAKRNREKEYLLALGRIRPEKGQAEAVTVAQRTGLPLIIAGEVVSGDAEGEKYYQERIKPFLDGWQIKQMGVVSRSQLVSLYQGALCLLMPISWEEPFGLVMIEAMSCGTPVIAFDRGSVAEVIRDGKTGFIVGDKTYRTYRTYKTYKSGIEGMVEAVRQFKVQSSKFKVQMRRNCRRWVDENFSMEKMVEGYERIYQKFKVQN